MDYQVHEDGATIMILMSVKYLLIFVGSYPRRLIFMYISETISLHVGAHRYVCARPRTFTLESPYGSPIRRCQERVHYAQ